MTSMQIGVTNDAVHTISGKPPKESSNSFSVRKFVGDEAFAARLTPAGGVFTAQCAVLDADLIFRTRRKRIRQTTAESNGALSEFRVRKRPPYV